jgi:hypothetical protein
MKKTPSKKPSKRIVRVKDLKPKKDTKGGRNLVTTLSKDVDRVTSP